MRGKRPFTLAGPIILAALLITLIYNFFGRGTAWGEVLKKILTYGFMIIFIGALITYVNWSEAKRRI